MAAVVPLHAARPVVSRAGWDDARPPDDGATGQALFWAFRPPVESLLPRVRRPDWVCSPIDQFVLAQLEASGIAPAAAADRRTLIRRATFDLIGLPPTGAEVEAFLADTAPDAFARVVNRLLASPHYGERWGRRWLDVARYADSNGMDENLAYGNAFRYRDYVVAAFNRDKPFDQFLREQLAGDLMPEPDDLPGTFERLTATGFLMLGPKMLAEDDPVKMEMDIIDEQLDTVGRAFLGLTLGCARCHDHKYDPITMGDYYGLAGIFKSTKTMDHFKVVARWQERPLATPAEIERRQAHQKQVDDKKNEINQHIASANDRLLAAARRRAGSYLLAASELNRQPAGAAAKPRMADPAVARPRLLALGGVTPTATLAGLLAMPRLPNLVLVEAEQFARGNVKREFTGYGQGIGVIYNQGELPNVAEYDIERTEAGPIQLELRYAAAESRPVRLLINGQSMKADAAGRVTGSWFPDTQTWTVEGVFALRAGKNTIRMERDGPFPHFDKLAIVPIGRGDIAAATAPKTAELLAAEHGLHVDMLRQWARYLEQTRGDANSVLAPWHAIQQAASPTTLPATLVADLRDTAARALAARYQALFDDADRAWQSLRLSSTGKEAKGLPDPPQEALRRLLHDPMGPFALPPRPESSYGAETLAALDRLRSELAVLEKSLPALTEVMAVAEGKAQDLRVHIRGSHLTLGAEVPRRVPRVLAESPVRFGDGHSGRLQLADWLARADHPLTARVLVNRIWQGHFGEALVRTPDNFGQLGDRPAHQPLLDWLAVQFTRGGWSVKDLHRRIMLSATYQMSTAYNERAAQIDPTNRLHWRMNRRRLDAESLRDAILMVSGRLDHTMRGTLFQGANRAYVPGYPNSNYDKYDFPRRSIYLPVLRSALYDVFQAFDFADPSSCTSERATTTVAPQALFMMNSRLMQDETRHMAAALLAREPDDTARIRAAYTAAYGRTPSDAEVARALQYLDRFERALDLPATAATDRRVRAWQSLCRTILAANEFVYVE
jgi:hypothetical protein